VLEPVPQLGEIASAELFLCPVRPGDVVPPVVGRQIYSVTLVVGGDNESQDVGNIVI
jgi:hypothetical protein